MNEAAPRAAPTRAQPRDAALPGRGEFPCSRRFRRSWS